jgi:hypothetical protein
MAFIETLILILALIFTSVQLVLLLRFNKHEGGDERSLIILGRSAIYSFSFLTMLICIVSILSMFIDFSPDMFKMLINGVLAISSISSLLSLQLIRRKF